MVFTRFSRPRRSWRNSGRSLFLRCLKNTKNTRKKYKNRTVS